MRYLRSITLIEWLVIAAILAVMADLFLLLSPEIRTEWQSCHLCRNHRWVRRQTICCFTWKQEVKSLTDEPVPEVHKHEWWTYSNYRKGLGVEFVACSSRRYKDD